MAVDIALLKSDYAEKSKEEFIAQLKENGEENLSEQQIENKFKQYIATNDKNRDDCQYLIEDAEKVLKDCFKQVPQSQLKNFLEELKANATQKEETATTDKDKLLANCQGLAIVNAQLIVATMEREK